MDESEIIQKSMAWTVPHLNYVHQFVRKHNLAIKHFAIQAIMQQFGAIVLVIGVEHLHQLEENIVLLGTEDIPQPIVQQWWKDLPHFPEKLLDPRRWELPLSPPQKT